LVEEMTVPTKLTARLFALPFPAQRATWASTLSGATAKKGIWAMGDQAVVSGTNFLCTILVGRWCGMSELGLYSMAFGALVLLSACQQSLILSPYAVLSNRRFGRCKERYAGSVLIQQGVFTALAMLVFGGIALVTSYVASLASLAPVFLMIAGVVPFISIREFIRRILLAELKVRATLVLDLSVAALQIAGILALGTANLLSATSAFAVAAVACGLVSIVWFSLTTMSFTVRWRLVRKTIGRNWRFGRWICASQLTDVVQTYSLHWIVAILLGVSATGVYAAYASIVMIFNPFILAVGGILLPRAAQVHHAGGVKELRRIVGAATLLIAVVLAVMCAPLAIYGDRLVHQIFDLGSVAPMQYLMILLLATGFVGTLSFATDSGLCVMERPELNFIAGLIGLIVACVLVPLSAYWWRIEGAALAAFIAVALASAVQVIGFLRVSRSGNQPESRA